MRLYSSCDFDSFPFFRKEKVSCGLVVENPAAEISKNIAVAHFDRPSSPFVRFSSVLFYLLEDSDAVV